MILVKLHWGNFVHVHQLNLYSIYCVVVKKTITALTLLVHAASLYDIKCNLAQKYAETITFVGSEKEKVFQVFFVRAGKTLMQYENMLCGKVVL